MLTMFDSTDIDAMPSNGDIYAGYIDGLYQTFHLLAAKFPGKIYIPITVFGAPNVKVVDCESGDLTPAQAAAWAKKEITANRRPTIYCSSDTHTQVVTELLGLGLAFVTDVDWWEAHYDGVAVLSPGSIAKQYQSTTDLDTSIVDPSWLGAAPTPPAPPPVPEKEMSMILDPILTLPNGADIVVQVGTDETSLYGKGRPADAQWNQNSNKLLAEIVKGTVPVQRISGSQYQLFAEEASDAHVVIFVTEDGITWDQLELA